MKPIPHSIECIVAKNMHSIVRAIMLTTESPEYMDLVCQIEDMGIPAQYEMTYQNNSGQWVHNIRTQTMGDKAIDASWQFNNAYAEQGVHRRLESIRKSIANESVSYDEIVELQSLAMFIPDGDTTLAQWAGIPEEEFCK